MKREMSSAATAAGPSPSSGHKRSRQVTAVPASAEQEDTREVKRKQTGGEQADRVRTKRQKIEQVKNELYERQLALRQEIELKKAAREELRKVKTAQDQTDQEQSRKRREQARRQRIEEMRQAAEEKAAEEKGAEEKGAEDKGAEEKGAEQKVAEKESAQRKAAEKEAAQQKAAEKRVAEDRAEKKKAERKAAVKKAQAEHAEKKKAEKKKAEKKKAAKEHATVPAESLALDNAIPLPRTWPAQVGAPATRGFNNETNYCYRSATLQALARIPQLLTALITSHGSPCKDARGKAVHCVACAMRDLFAAYHTSNAAASTALRALNNAIARTGRVGSPKWLFRQNTQQDAHEFNLYMLNSALEARGIDRPRFRKSFMILTRSNWTCLDCKHKSIADYSEQPDFALHVHPTEATLEECIRKEFITREPLTRRCEVCKDNKRQTRHMTIRHAPDVLTVMIQRFGMDKWGNAARKNTKLTNIPSTLNLSPWAVDPATNMQYTLQSVVMHLGSSPSVGHYTAMIKRGNEWVCADDSSISTMRPRDVQGSRQMTPYLLTYVKV